MNYENQKSGNGNRPDERPERKPTERRQSEQEGSGYSPQREQQQQDSGNDASYSEQNDVTPPNQKEFPTEGPSRADFRPQHHSRSTGRMVGHEPGTESV